MGNTEDAHVHEHTHTDGNGNTWTHTHGHEHTGDHTHAHEHEHEHTHTDGNGNTWTHTHSHDHDGDHQHTHDHSAEGGPAGDPARALAMMKYMYHHNESHLTELMDTVGMLNDSGKPVQAVKLEGAAELFRLANRVLQEVLAEMESPE